MSNEGTPDQQRLVLSVSDQAQLGSLARWLQNSRVVQVEQIPGQPGAGEQGALDLLTVLAGSGGLVAAIKVLPEFLRSKRSGISITMTVKDQPFTLNATNVDEVLPILERLLDA